MICDRCDRPMAPAETETRDMPGASGAGCTLYLHEGRCPAPPSPRPRTYSPRNRLNSHPHPGPPLAGVRAGFSVGAARPPFDQRGGAVALWLCGTVGAGRARTRARVPEFCRSGAWPS